MGADIHLFAERKLPDGTWAMCRSYGSQSSRCFAEQLSSWTIFYRARSRNYNFFAALANVRGPGPAPKGLPQDVSPLVAYESDRWGSDGHSHSWHSARDFVKLFFEHQLTGEERANLAANKLDTPYPVDITHAVMDDHLGISADDGEADDYRFVFWFDN